MTPSTTDDPDLEDDDSVTEDDIQFCLMELERELFGDEPDEPVEKMIKKIPLSGWHEHAKPHFSPTQMTLDLKDDDTSIKGRNRSGQSPSVHQTELPPKFTVRTEPERPERPEDRKVASAQKLLKFKKTMLHINQKPAGHWYS